MAYPFGSADVAHRLLACLIATAAGFCADPAVLMLPGVALALVAAHLAGGRGRLHHLPSTADTGTSAR
jgi:hypothetical protein